MASIYDGPAGPFQFLIEQWEPYSRAKIVLGAFTGVRPAVAYYVEMLRYREGHELRLRRSPAGEMVERAGMNSSVTEWTQDSHIAALHGIGVNIVCAQAAFNVAEPAEGMILTLHMWGMQIGRKPEDPMSTRQA